jgi:hypothetical protein
MASTNSSATRAVRTSSRRILIGTSSAGPWRWIKAPQSRSLLRLDKHAPAPLRLGKLEFLELIRCAA